MTRSAICKRKTLETHVTVELNLDGVGLSKVNTGHPFFDHMLETFSKHSRIDLRVKAETLKTPSVHHLVEDVALTLGEALDKALADRRGVRRFGFASIPMDDALAEVSLDLSGRPYLHVESLPMGVVEGFDSILMEHFLRSLAQTGRFTIHVPRVYGRDLHHVFEALFKALAVALREASRLEPGLKDEVPSTKGVL
ncbi:imidazoleglycerol-phosphate dehydratase HisB [Candidatus Bathyarchaeota archaeon]|nr:imidazoleglycerol-phosphate dehydratase HisB [Candidatus Bathyarchaeota archaeon]